MSKRKPVIADAADDQPRVALGPPEYDFEQHSVLGSIALPDKVEHPQVLGVLAAHRKQYNVRLMSEWLMGHHFRRAVPMDHGVRYRLTAYAQRVKGATNGPRRLAAAKALAPAGILLSAPGAALAIVQIGARLPRGFWFCFPDEPSHLPCPVGKKWRSDMAEDGRALHTGREVEYDAGDHKVACIDTRDQTGVIDFRVGDHESWFDHQDLLVVCERS